MLGAGPRHARLRLPLLTRIYAVNADGKRAQLDRITIYDADPDMMEWLLADVRVTASAATGARVSQANTFAVIIAPTHVLSFQAE